MYAYPVGFYPPSKFDVYDENSVVDENDRDWASRLYHSVEEAAAFENQWSIATRSVIMRLGMVLGEGGGAWDYMRIPFSCCLGGTFGDGSQWFPYVHLADAVRAYEHALFDHRAQGPINVVAPEVCDNKMFASTLGRAMYRPTIVQIPKFVSALIGTDRGSMIFSGQHVKPNVLTSLGFKFQCPDATSCCTELVGDKQN